MSFWRRPILFTHQQLTHEVVGRHSLLFTWQGLEASAVPILLMAHIDVVPVEPGTESNWTHPPFAGEVANGFIWGRESGSTTNPACSPFSKPSKPA